MYLYFLPLPSSLNAVFPKCMAFFYAQTSLPFGPPEKPVLWNPDQPPKSLQGAVTTLNVGPALAHGSWIVLKIFILCYTSQALRKCLPQARNKPWLFLTFLSLKCQLGSKKHRKESFYVCAYLILLCLVPFSASPFLPQPLTHLWDKCQQECPADSSRSVFAFWLDSVPGQAPTHIPYHPRLCHLRFRIWVGQRAWCLLVN